MNTLQVNKIRNILLSITMMAVLAILAGCERSDQTVDTAERQTPADQPERDQRSDEDQRTVGDQQPDGDQQPEGGQRPLEHVIDADGFTLRANVSRTDMLSDSMARQYGIEPESDLVLLNLVILEEQSDQQPAPVSAAVSAQYESLSGHREAIDMRAVEADGHVSYIGTLDASDQRTFQLDIEALPAGTDQPLQMNFEVELEAFDSDDFE